MEKKTKKVQLVFMPVISKIKRKENMEKTLFLVFPI
jgi:hypothetical protein